MQQVYKTLPDDKPITSICVVEDPSKCPAQYHIVARTHDQDSDADLWRETQFFGRRITRYLCLSKTEGNSDYIVENVGIISEKELPPDGYSIISRTVDGGSKAWRKRQLCYSLIKKNLATAAVTDIIILSKGKRAPEGFSLAGEINSLALCYKISTELDVHIINAPVLSYSLNPISAVETRPSSSKPSVTNGYMYPLLGKSQPISSPNDEYVNLIRPTRPAPQIPPKRKAPNVPGSYLTLYGHNGLEGVPLVLNPALESVDDQFSKFQLPAMEWKTKEEIDKEYFYDFRLERQT